MYFTSGVFLVQFATVLIYVVTFLKLRQKTKALFRNAQAGRAAPNMATVQAVNRITKLMTLYPCVYVVLTLPLSAGRMWSMAHNARPYSDSYACIAGALITSCGWVDSLLYTLTRKKLLRETMPNSSSRRTGSNWDNELGSKGITHTRTITVEGGQVMDTLDPTHAELEAGPAWPSTSARQSASERFGSERPPSPAGSTDPILSSHSRTGKRKPQAPVGMQEIMAEEQEKNDEISPLPQGWVRHH